MTSAQAGRDAVIRAGSQTGVGGTSEAWEEGACACVGAREAGNLAAWSWAIGALARTQWRRDELGSRRTGYGDVPAGLGRD